MADEACSIISGLIEAAKATVQWTLRCGCGKEEITDETPRGVARQAHRRGWNLSQGGTVRCYACTPKEEP
jgi:hypothetical protein